jgi:hypothetical protein
MATWYAQNSAGWLSAAWNDSADGQGSPGSPVAGDTADANGRDVDVASASDLSSVSLWWGNGGSFYSSAWYAQGSGDWGAITWNTAANGTGFWPGTFSLSHPTTGNMEANAHTVWVRQVIGTLTNTLGGAFRCDGSDGAFPAEDYVLKADVAAAADVRLDTPRWAGATGEGFVGTLVVGGGGGEDYVLKTDVAAAADVRLDTPRWAGATGEGFVGTAAVIDAPETGVSLYWQILKPGNVLAAAAEVAVDVKLKTGDGDTGKGYVTNAAAHLTDAQGVVIVPGVEPGATYQARLRAGDDIPADNPDDWIDVLVPADADGATPGAEIRGRI